MNQHLSLLARFERLADGRFDVRCPRTRERIGRDGAHVRDCEPLTGEEMDAAVRRHSKACGTSPPSGQV